MDSRVVYAPARSDSRGHRKNKRGNLEAAETLLLARAQFGLNIGFPHPVPEPHHRARLVPAVLPRPLRAHAATPAWLATYRLWTKVFALSFAMGVVSGITMCFQFGTNWPGFMNKVGNIAGPLLAYEVLTAFFLEATFLGVMLFGMNRVPGWLHIAVALPGRDRHHAVGVLDPRAQFLDADAAGQVIADGAAASPATGWQVIFNPCFPYRFAHMLLASGLTASFVVAGLSAWRLLQRAGGRAARAHAARRHRWSPRCSRRCRSSSATMHGLNTLEHQPAKIAAMEAIWETERGAPLVLFALPNEDDAAQRLRDRGAEGREPDPDARSRRRDEGPGRVRAGHARRWRRCSSRSASMVGVGVLMLALAWLGAWLLRRGRAAAALAAVGVRGLHLLRLDRDARRLARDRDRPPALAGHRHPAHRRRRRRASPAPQLGASLTGYVLTYALMLRRLHGGDHAPRAARAAATTRAHGRMTPRPAARSSPR